MPSETLINSGKIAPSDTRYKVVMEQGVASLFPGDLVIMVVTPIPDQKNYWLRLTDMSLHHLSDEHDQYVIVAPIHA